MGYGCADVPFPNLTYLRLAKGSPWPHLVSGSRAQFLGRKSRFYRKHVAKFAPVLSFAYFRAHRNDKRPENEQAKNVKDVSRGQRLLKYLNLVLQRVHEHTFTQAKYKLWIFWLNKNNELNEKNSRTKHEKLSFVLCCINGFRLDFPKIKKSLFLKEKSTKKVYSPWKFLKLIYSQIIH